MILKVIMFVKKLTPAEKKHTNDHAVQVYIPTPSE